MREALSVSPAYSQNINYPFGAPDIYLKTKIYHPYVFRDSGWFNTDLLIKTDWVLTKKMRGPMSCPYSDELLLEPLILEEYLNNFPQFNKNAQEWAKLYAN